MNSVKLNMKKSILLISMFAMALGFVACSNDDDIIEQPVVTLPQDNKMTVSAIVSDEITRTALGDGNSVVWSEGDSIMIGGQKFTLQSGKGTTKGEFTGTTLANGEYDVFYGVSVSDGSKSISDVQTYNSAKKIADAPMYARVTVTNGVAGPIKFTNLCGLIKLTIKEGSAPKTIKRITISSSSAMAGEFDITGNAAVIKNSFSYDFMALNCGGAGVEIGSVAKDFYIAVPQNSYTHFDITLLAADNTVCTKAVNANTSIVVQRTKITNVSFKAEGFVNPGEFVDLGLPSGTKWATKNVGADDSKSIGNYYTWGNITSYNSDKLGWGTNYGFGFQRSLTKYCTNSDYGEVDNKIALEDVDDVAFNHKDWGHAWRVPTKEEIQELIDECTWERTLTGGNNGYFTIKGPNGNSIELPLTSYYNGTNKKLQTSAGYANYWTRSLNAASPDEAWSLSASNTAQSYVSRIRIMAFPVRPVLR